MFLPRKLVLHLEFKRSLSLAEFATLFPVFFSSLFVSTLGKAVCQFPGEPKDGYIVPTKFHYFVGEGISVVCKANHQPLGPAFIYCTREGKWSAPLTSCVMILQEKEEEQQGKETKMPLEEEYRRKQQPHYHASMNPGERQQ